MNAVLINLAATFLPIAEGEEVSLVRPAAISVLTQANVATNAGKSPTEIATCIDVLLAMLVGEETILVGKLTNPASAAPVVAKLAAQSKALALPPATRY
jgi:hypothetical protein